MTHKQELIIGLTTLNIAEFVNNLATTSLNIEDICIEREEAFLENLTMEELNSISTITDDGTVINEDSLISLLESKQFNAPDELSIYHPFQSEQEKLNFEAREYLKTTDWYVIRLQETGEAIPQDILDSRAEARLVVV